MAKPIKSQRQRLHYQSAFAEGYTGLVLVIQFIAFWSYLKWSNLSGEFCESNNITEEN